MNTSRKKESSKSSNPPSDKTSPKKDSSDPSDPPNAPSKMSARSKRKEYNNKNSFEYVVKASLNKSVVEGKYKDTFLEEINQRVEATSKGIHRLSIAIHILIRSYLDGQKVVGWGRNPVAQPCTRS